MHTPTLRLVSLHPSLSVTLSFVRVPEIHETFTWKVFFARASTAKDVIDAVVEELGLARTLPIPGAGTLRICIGRGLWRMVNPNASPVSLYLLPSNSIPGPTRLSPSVDFSEILEAAQKKSPANSPSYRFVYLTSGIEGAEQGRYPQVP
jgi:diaphanous 1